MKGDKDVSSTFKEKNQGEGGAPPRDHPPALEAYARQGAGTTPPGFRSEVVCKHTQNGHTPAKDK